MSNEGKNIYVTLGFEKTTFPPFEDILILGKNCPLGMRGIGECLDLLVPDGFKRFEVEDNHVAAVIINRNILKRLNSQRVIEILKNKIFPFVAEDEIIRVQFTTKITYDSFAVE